MPNDAVKGTNNMSFSQQTRTETTGNFKGTFQLPVKYALAQLTAYERRDNQTGAQIMADSRYILMIILEACMWTAWASVCQVIWRLEWGTRYFTSLDLGVGQIHSTIRKRCPATLLRLNNSTAEGPNALMRSRSFPSYQYGKQTTQVQFWLNVSTKFPFNNSV